MRVVTDSFITTPMTSRDTSKIFESFRKTSQVITTICRKSEVNINIEIFWTNVKYVPIYL